MGQQLYLRKDQLIQLLISWSSILLLEVITYTKPFQLGEELQCKMKHGNIHNNQLYSFAVEDIIVRHLPRNISTPCHLFLHKVVLYCVLILLMDLGDTQLVQHSPRWHGQTSPPHRALFLSVYISTCSAEVGQSGKVRRLC